AFQRPLLHLFLKSKPDAPKHRPHVAAHDAAQHHKRHEISGTRRRPETQGLTVYRKGLAHEIHRGEPRQRHEQAHGRIHGVTPNHPPLLGHHRRHDPHVLPKPRPKAHGNPTPLSSATRYPPAGPCGPPPGRPASPPPAAPPPKRPRPRHRPARRSSRPPPDPPPAPSGWHTSRAARR